MVSLTSNPQLQATSSTFGDPGGMLPLHAESAPDLDAGNWYPACSGCSQVPGFRALARHTREDKAAVVALAVMQGWTARGARLRKGGFGRGTGSFHGNVLGEERETKRARSSRARASRDGKSRGRRWLCCAGSCAIHSSLSLPSNPTASPAPRMRWDPWLLEAGLVTTRTGMTRDSTLQLRGSEEAC